MVEVRGRVDGYDGYIEKQLFQVGSNVQGIVLHILFELQPSGGRTLGRNNCGMRFARHHLRNWLR